MHTYANQADDVREMVEMVITRLVRCDRVLHQGELGIGGEIDHTLNQ